jgi:hypothetical protein
MTVPKPNFKCSTWAPWEYVLEAIGFYALFLGWVAEDGTGDMRKELSGRRTTIDLVFMLANGMPTCRAEEKTQAKMPRESQ